MALIRIPETSRVITGAAPINDFLSEYGIQYENWPVAGRVNADAGAEEILTAYAEEIEQLKERAGYITADVVNVTPETPNLQAMLDRFNQEHTHAEDEVRFIVKGRGIFYIHVDEQPVFAIEIEEGDLINVPAGTKHWFDLCADKTIRAIRLFREQAGWTPLYTGDTIAAGHQPLCLGPNYLRGGVADVANVAISA
jgi:1,2-dihydroxy-3-keto-5-methylthiopentene dioxygenase